MSKSAQRFDPLENHLLAALPDEEYRRLRSELQQVTVSLGQVLYEAGQTLDHAYFPVTSVVSLLYTTRDGSTAEMGLTGNDGVVGISLFLGGDTAPHSAVAQIAGSAF